MNFIVGEKYEGMVYAGEASCDSVFGGRPLPLFELPPETAESWNAKCRAQFLRYYVQENGHNPEDFEAAYAEHLRKINIAIGRLDSIERVVYA